MDWLLDHSGETRLAGGLTSCSVCKPGRAGLAKRHPAVDRLFGPTRNRTLDRLGLAMSGGLAIDADIQKIER